MILVDTSVWIEHFRVGNERLKSLLYENEVLTHPFVIGELACGSIQDRNEVLRLLQALPKARTADDREVLRFIETRQLYGQGIGWTDAHLLASALLSSASLWTLDKRLSQIALRLRVSA